ncbi:flagellar filament capping protein FliD [Pseudoduganella umbonata]|uniref:Flagellar hook-associated protein 2 n=1 Tax=Pseudoduganella umbonata TaxID=864828 RepID=A0A4P8HLP4_9BURK|nr:flagellar filament capping protein FliD [Pseudoduganella umbonata]MBB3221431.1 flagellar hook-associated protein 2 [Pseudoduganella umbonata]QCP10587.1 lateral flagellar hook-associated protein 2 [Pseudoduganella umbonata]
MATSAPTYDPKSTATQLATAYIQGRQTILTNTNTMATSTEKALDTLGTALSSFESAMSSLSSKTSVVATTATFSSAVGTATATPAAAAGTYSFFVEQLATVSQVKYSGLSDTTPIAEAKTINVTVGSMSFEVNLASADQNGDMTLSVKEMAVAINAASGNTAKVTASTMTVGGVQTLVLTSNETGADTAIKIEPVDPMDGTAMTNALLDTGNFQELVKGKDAIVYLGEKSGGVTMQQASNTFEVVDGVSMTFTKAQALNEPPVTLKVGTDSSGTATNLQSFVDGWNKLVGTMQSLTAAGSASSGTSAGIFHADAGIQALYTRMQSLLRTQVDGQSLVTFGIAGNRDGTISLDTSRLNKALAANPAALDKIIGSTSSTAPSGVLAGLDKLMDGWTNSTSGQLNKRRDANTQLQDSLLERQTRLDTQYESAYIRYLNQFTTLQTLQAQMEGTTSMFDAMFSNDD